MKRLPTSVLFLLFFCLFAWACQEKTSVPEGFEIEAGFSLERVAAEPLIKDPVDLEFNELGDALVLEMPGYPFEDQQSRIVVLKDQDQDGIYDDKIIFIEGLQLASSFLPYKQGLLVAAPPYLLYVQDENLDYIPEKVDTLMGGFATGNLQHNFNGLTLGLDNWIYAANGGNDGEPFWWDEPETKLDLRGQDFRIDLETKTIERLGESSGGFELAMDEYGRIFETHNLEHISQLVFPDRYMKSGQTLIQHTLHNISDHEENGLARIYPIGEQESRVNHPEQSGYFSGACGITYYGGGDFGREYDQTVWVADVVLNLIHVDQIKSNGAGFTASRIQQNHDFLASSDRAFRPVNMTVGPDGAMYVVDMYRKVIEHPEWIPDDIEKTLDLEEGKDQGRIYRIAKANSKSEFEIKAFSSQTGLVNSLSHANQWVRNTAHRLLLDQDLSQETLGKLRQTLKGNDEYSKLHAVWVLNGKAELKEEEILAALRDSSPQIREKALLIAEQKYHTSRDLIEESIELLTDSESSVRMQAALSLSTLEGKNLVDSKQSYLTAIEGAAAFPSDQWNMAAYTLAAGEFSTELLVKLLEKPSSKIPDEFLSSLALSSSKIPEEAPRVLEALNKSRLALGEKEQIIHEFSTGLEGANAQALEPYIASLEANDHLGMISELAALRSKLQLPTSPQFLQLSQAALTKVLDTSLPDSTRLQQLTMLELLPYSEKSTVLFQCLDNSQPLKLQENALRQLSMVNEKEIGVQIVNRWQALSPQTRRYASDLLLYIETHHDALLTGLENGDINIGEMNFDLERRRTLLRWTDNEETKRRAALLISDSGVTNRKEAIDQMKPALALEGSAVHGAKVYENVCANCHMYENLGKEVGPVLTEIGRKSKETNFYDILDPNTAVDTKYINHRLETHSGVVHMGIVATETDQNLTIKKMGGESVTINKSDIKEFRSLGTSLMMEGLENSMSHQEMADLLAFLQNGSTPKSL